MKEKNEKQKKSSDQIIKLIVEAAEKKKAVDLKVLDVSKTSKVVDFLIICSGESTAQIQAIEKEIDKTLRNNKIKGFRWQGEVKSGWVVLDLGAVVIHIMGTVEREYYNLEELWEKDAITYHY